MRWEKRELRVVLEMDSRKPVINRECELCGALLLVGHLVCSIGIVDRRTEQKYRWYLCNDCKHFFDQTVEDSPSHVQQYLSDARFAEEIWVR